MDRPLLVLDLDETLIHASEHSLDREPDFTVERFAVLRRPHLDRFLERMARSYTLAVWSSAGDAYVRAIVEVIARDVELAFVWGNSRGTLRRDHDRDEWFYAKDLVKLRRRYDLARTLIVDDDPRKVARSYGNAIYVREFLGDPADDELVLLADYLDQIRDRPNYRGFEKRGWRRQVGG